MKSRLIQLRIAGALAVLCTLNTATGFLLTLTAGIPLDSSAGLIGHWTFDQDYSSEVNSTLFGAAVQGAPSVSTNAPALGQGCLFLDNSGSTISGLSISNPDLLSIGTNSWTTTFWMKRVGRAPSDSSDNYGTMLASGWTMYIQDRGSPREIRTYCSSALVSNPARAAYEAPTGTWSFVAIVFDRTTLTNRIYRYDTSESNPELVLEKESALSSGYNVLFSDFTIGYVNSASPTQAFDGYLDDVRVYDHALSRTEIEQLIGMPGGASALPWQENYEIYNPTQENGLICDYNRESLRYKHCSTMAHFKGKWIAMFNANTVPKESESGQLMYMSVSTNGLDWNDPELAFASSNRSENVIPSYTAAAQWQPELILSPDSNELWCIWSQLSVNQYRELWHGTYFSVLDDPDGMWTNTRIKWNGDPDIYLDVDTGTNSAYRVFPTQNPVRTSGGRLLVPVILTGPYDPNAPSNVWRNIKRASVIYSDDDGSTWGYSEGTTVPNAKWTPWEPTVWEQPNGNIGMVFRNNDTREGSISPAEAVFYSESADGGATWTVPEYVPFEGLVSLMQVNRSSYSMGDAPAEWDRYVMAYNDWPHQEPMGEPSSGRDRFNLSLFFNRGSGSQFVPGLMFSDYRVACYPKMWIETNTCWVSWTTGVGNNCLHVTKVSPLPDVNTNYVFPRKRAYHDTYRPALDSDGLYRFQGEQYISCSNQVQFYTKFSLGTWTHHNVFGPLADTRDTQGGQGIMLSGYGGRPALYIPGVGYIYSDVPTNTSYSPIYVPVDDWYYWGVSCDLSGGTVDFYIRGHDVNDGDDGAFYWHQQKTFNPSSVNLSALNHEMQLGRMFPESGLSPLSGTYSGFWGTIRLFEFYENQCLTEEQQNYLFNKCRNEFGFNAASPSSAPSAPKIYYNPVAYPSLSGFSLPSGSLNGTYELDLTNNTLKLNGQISAGLDTAHHEILEGDAVDVNFSFQALYSNPGTVFTCGDYNNPVRLKYAGGRLSLVSDAASLDCGPVRDGEWNSVELSIDGLGVSARLNHIGDCVTVSNTPAGLWLFLGEGYRDHEITNVMSSTSRMLYAIDTVQTRVREYAYEIGWWKFDGDGLDFSGCGNFAVLTNGADYTTNTANPAVSEAALMLDGSDDFAEINGVDPLQGSLTVACRVKSDPAVWNESSCLISRRPAFVLYPVKNTTTLKFGIWDAGAVFRSAGYDLSSISGFDICEWHHYAGTYDQGSGQVKLYVDGVLCAWYNTDGGEIQYDDGRICIGREDDWVACFSGAIDDVKIFDKALDDDALYRLAYGLNP